ncbi:MAG TPA: HNH endonuclease signature motif containing protein [Terriglobales bacterium]|nr:HNH endonuclease signature motif containing protein [Terriglobales bacterium]
MSDARDWGRGDQRRIATRDFPPEVLALVDERQGGRFCVACRDAALVTPEGEPLEIDHRQPLSKGGDNAWTNLMWLCRAHNRGKCSRSFPPAIPRWARGRPSLPRR